MLLYGRNPIPEDLDAPSPGGSAPSAPNAHLRWHPLRGEWVAYASHRQNRTFLPPPEYNPLARNDRPVAPHRSTGRTVGRGRLRESLSDADPRGSRSTGAIRSDRAGQRRLRGGGLHAGRVGLTWPLPLSHIELLIEVWADRYTELGSRPEVEYVFPFENRGVEVGVTLHHPHGQIYAYPFVPPVPARELEQQRRTMSATVAA